MRALRVALLVWFCSLAVWAGDLKKEMIETMDAICQGGKAAEAAIDWDHLNIIAPSLAGRDLQAFYRTMNDAQKAAFRRGFISTFSRSFRTRARGNSFAVASQRPGAFKFNTSPQRPSFTALGGSRKLTVEFNRVGGRLKLARMLSS